MLQSIMSIWQNFLMQEGIVCLLLQACPCYVFLIMIDDNNWLHIIAEPAVDFAVSLIQTLEMNNSKVISELHHLVDALAKVICIYYVLSESELML